MVLLDLDNNLMSHEIAICEYKQSYSISFMLDVTLRVELKKGHRFLLYEDKGRQQRVADVLLTAPPKGPIYFERVPMLVNLIITPSDGSNKIVISIPFSEWNTLLGCYLAELIREVVTRLDGSPDQGTLTFDAPSYADVEYNVVEASEALVAFVKERLSVVLYLNTIVQSPRWPSTGTREYYQHICDSWERLNAFYSSTIFASGLKGEPKAT